MFDYNKRLIQKDPDNGPGRPSAVYRRAPQYRCRLGSHILAWMFQIDLPCSQNLLECVSQTVDS